MEKKINVVFVRNPESSYFEELSRQLAGQSASVGVVEKCKNLTAILRSKETPDLIFTDLKLSDGTWEKVIRITEKSTTPVGVVVVSRLVDTRLYVEALENGAFDFITPPFETSAVAHVLKTAYWSVTQKRKAMEGAPLLAGAPKMQPQFSAIV